MDQIKEFLTRRNIIALLVIAVLAVGLLVSIRLVQQQTQLKSKAAGEFICDGTLEKNFCIQFLDDATRTGNITVGKAVAVIVVAKAEFGDTNVYLDGTYKTTAPGNVEVVYAGGGTNPCTGDQSYQYCWKFTIAEVVNQVYRETFKSTEAPQGRVAGAFQPQAPPSPSPSPTDQPKTIRGTLKKSDNTPFPDGFKVNIRYDNSDHIALTQSNGQFSIDVSRGKQYAVRPNDLSGYDKKTDLSGFCGQDSCGSYENQLAGGSPDCASGCNFTYTLLREARCTSFSIKDSSNADVTGGPIYQDKNYTFNMTMTSLGATVWGKTTHKLKSVPGANTIDQIFTGFNDTYDMVETSVGKDGQAHFSDTVTASALPEGVNSQVRRLVYSMNDAQGNFGGWCEQNIQVNRPGISGPGESPTPAPVDFDVDTGGDRTVTQGSTISQVVEVTRRDSNPGSPSVNLSVSGFPTGVSGSFSGTSCAPRVNESCTRTLTIEAAGNASTITSTVTVTAKYGQLEKRADFHLTVRPATTAFNFTVSTPSDITLTKGQSDAGRNITISKTAGDAEDVTLSVSGDLGSAVASFKPSSSCKPENNSQCQRILTFDTAAATAGEYVVEIQGRASGGRTQVSNPFRLKINPSVGTVTCFVVSESGNTVSLFKDCLQSSIDNINQSGSLAGFIEDTPLFPNFQLSSGNVQKTLFVRFLQIPEGGFIKGSCTANPNKCKETTAGITLALPIPTPTPTPTPTPVTGCICQTDNSCSSPCLFEEISPEPSGVTYTTPKKCNPMPGHSITANKNVWCQNRTLRTKGDADGDGKVNSKDYLFLLTGQFNGTLPANVYPDFNGNGVADNQDLIIWQNAPKTP